MSSNRHKFEEVRRLLEPEGIPVSHHNAALEELQSDSLREIALHKARHAHHMVGGPVLVEDDGLFIDSLNGFPGPYSSYAFGTIGNAGILKLLGGRRRGARFAAVAAYADENGAVPFEGEVRGRIADAVSGDGWGYDPIFVPDGAAGTFARIQKGPFSHRALAVRKFARWRAARRSA